MYFEYGETYKSKIRQNPEFEKFCILSIVSKFHVMIRISCFMTVSTLFICIHKSFLIIEDKNVFSKTF